MQNFNEKLKIDITQRCFKFSLEILSFCDSLPNKRSAWVIEDQLIRSATSIGANLVEGKASSSRLEFKKYYEIALKSSNETKYWIALLREANLGSREKLNYLLKENIEIANILAKGVISLKKK